MGLGSDSSLPSINPRRPPAMTDQALQKNSAKRIEAGLIYLLPVLEESGTVMSISSDTDYEVIEA
jgi:hypothetical protein